MAKLLHISENLADQWNQFVTQWPEFIIMQNYEWGTFKEKAGWKVIRLGIEENGQLVAGAQMLIKPTPFQLANFAYIPKGPLVDWNKKPVVQTLLSGIHQAARKHKAIFLRIEPPLRYSFNTNKTLEFYNFQCSEFTNQPQSSMLIDLTPDPEEILARMHKTTRYNIRYSARKGVEVREATEQDLAAFYKLITYTAQKVGFPARSFEYYCSQWKTFLPTEQVKVFMAIYEGEVIAVRMPAICGKIAATLHSGSFDMYKQLKPNELLMWHSIEWAKAQGCTTYDVWGIPNEVGKILRAGEPLPKNRHDGLWGVFRFKQGFGGNFVYYAGAYDYIYIKTVYKLINLITTSLGSPDKVLQMGSRLNIFN